MKLIKITSDKVTIRSDDVSFAEVRLNDLIKISDGNINLVTMVTLLTDNDAEQPEYAEEDYIMDSIGSETSIKVIECSIIGTLDKNNHFRKMVDKYPTTNITADIISNKTFANMIQEDVTEGFLLGKYSEYDDCPAFLNGNKLFQRHACVVGNTGSGKSETVAKVMESASKLKGANIVLFDIHGEYSDISYVDSMKIGKDVDFPIWLFGFQDMCYNILKINGESATSIMTALRKSYRNACHACETKPNENKPVFFDFNDFMGSVKFLNEQEIPTGETYKTGAKAGQDKTTKGDFNGKLSSVLNQMSVLKSDARYSFLFNTDKTQGYVYELVNWLMDGNKPVRSIDLSGVPHDIAIAIIGAITKLLYNVQLAKKPEQRTAITLFCDEAHIYIPTSYELSSSERRMTAVFENIAKEGRKFGFTLFVASQRPSELNKTIMAQCANFLVMKLNNEADKQMIKGMLPDGNDSIIDNTTMFQPGDLVAIGDSAPIPMKIHVSLANERPMSRTIDFWSEWAKGNKRATVDEEIIERYLEE